MRLIKYDGAPDSTKTTILGGGSSSSSGGGESGGGASRGDDASRKIWGQNDTGDDIDGTQTVHGNVIIKAITPPHTTPMTRAMTERTRSKRKAGAVWMLRLM